MQKETIFELKGQARRLRTALEELQLSVTHTQAMNLVARAHGHRSWEVLESDIGTKAAVDSALQQCESKAKKEQDQWLNWLGASLRMRGVREGELDELVHEALAPHEASKVNNDGIKAQLEALFEWHLAVSPTEVLRARASTVEQLETQGLTLPLPGSANLGSMKNAGIPATVRICAGSPFEREMTVDCIEWFANHSVADIERLVLAGLSNNIQSDEVALWLENQSQNEGMRNELRSLMTLMRETLAASKRPTSNITGVTMHIDEDCVAVYVDAHQAAGMLFSDVVLKKLALIKH